MLIKSEISKKDAEYIKKQLEATGLSQIYFIFLWADVMGIVHELRGVFVLSIA